MKKFKVYDWFGVAGIVFIYCLFMPVKGYSEPTDKIQQVATQLKKHFPDVRAQDIQASKINGIFQVTRGPSVVYVTEDGRYIFSGDIIDVNDKFNNITEKARRSARVSAIKDVKAQNAILFAPKKVKHTITVFTDIDCGYCRKFHGQIKELNDKGIAVQYLAFPRSGPDTPSYKKAINVWCSKNKNQALTTAKNGEQVKAEICDDHHVNEQFQLGILMGVNGTPTIILENGTVIPGYLTPKKLARVIRQEMSKPE
tara:strand:+ start:23856 stop:24620 length:765 start_codon:yes stop_codon:yes gene_type:complete